MLEERPTRRRIIETALIGSAIAVAGCSRFGGDQEADDSEAADGDGEDAELMATIAASAGDRADVYGHFEATFSPEHDLRRIASNEVPGAIQLLGEMEAMDGFAASPPADAMAAVDVAPTPSPVDVLTEAASHYDTIEQAQTRSVLERGSVTELSDSDASASEAWEASNANDTLEAAATDVVDAVERYRDEPSESNRTAVRQALEAERDATHDIDEIREWGRIEPGYYSEGYATTEAARVVKATAIANVNAVVAFRAAIDGHLARLTDRSTSDGPGTADDGRIDVPSGAAFADGFEDGSFGRWTPLELPDHARSFEESNDWSVTDEAITGEYALHVSTRGDVNENAIATDEPVVDLSRDFTLGWSWRTPDPSNRGPRLRLLGSGGTDFTGRRSADYADSLRLSMDGDAISREGSPWTGTASLGETTVDRPSYAADTDHTVRIRKRGSTATLAVDGERLVETDGVATSGRYRLVLLTSGTWGDASSMTFDDVFVNYE